MLDEIRRRPPVAISDARRVAHRAAQLLTSAARANLDAVPDDSHSNLNWDVNAHRFLSRPLTDRIDASCVGLSLSPLGLSIIADGRSTALLELNMVSFTEAAGWLDSQLAERHLKLASSVTVPYELSPETEAVSAFRPERIGSELSVLSAWFDLAQTVLSRFAQARSDLDPGPSPVRCWPHHFDIATYVQLEEGGFETARGIGVGMSPGDGSYDQPYFYVNPWPQLDTNDLPDLPVPGHWHSEGFVGAIATADEVLTLEDINTQLPAFVKAAFAIGREKLGI